LNALVVLIDDPMALLRFFPLMLVACAPHGGSAPLQAVDSRTPAGISASPSIDRSYFEVLDSLSFESHGGRFELLVLKNREVGTEGARYRWEGVRPLLLYAYEANGERSLVARNDSAVLCLACGGIFDDPYERIEFKEDSLLVRHYGGSNWRWAITQWFVHGADGNWPLVRRREVTYSVFDPESTMEVDAALPERPASLGTWNNYDR